MTIQRIINDKDFLLWLNRDSGFWDDYKDDEYLIKVLKNNPKWAVSVYNQWSLIDFILFHD